VKKGLFFIIIILVLQISSFSSDKIRVDLISQFYLDQSKEFLGRAKDMAIDNYENIFIVDNSLPGIKIYNLKGILIKSFGRKGAGPGEFMGPYTIDCHNGKFCVQDVGLYKYLIFNKDFEEITRFFYFVDGYDFILQENRIISNDYFMDEKANDFRGIILDFSGKVIKALMPITFVKSDAWNRITNSRAFVDVSKKGEIYFVKEREVKFHKFDKEGKFLKNFGENPSYFVPCKITKDFKHAVFSSDSNRGSSWERWRHSFTWVSGIFVLEDFLGIAIRKYNNEHNKWDVYLQFYDHEGNLINGGLKLKEPGTSSVEGFFIDSNHMNRIYILEVIEEEEPQYKFYKYKVNRG